MKDWTHLQDIEGTDGDGLAGRLIGLAITGSIAAVESHRLARTLMRQGAKVQIFLTPAAAELVSPTALAWSTGRPVITELTARCEHLEFFGERGAAHCLLLAPTTANTVSKIAGGLDDNVVTTCVTTALGGDIPVLCAPGMHAPMMRNPALVSNLAKLREYGIELLEPTHSEGKEKMMGVEEIVARVSRCLGEGTLRGKSVLITGGPTREFIDPARCLTNPSSGLTACLLAEEAFRRGAEVTLIYGPGRVRPPKWIPVREVESTAEMLEAARRTLKSDPPDFVVAAAAVCDYRPARYSEQKISTGSGELTLQLEATEKIIDALREEAPAARLVAFKAGSTDTDEDMLKLVKPYLLEGRADMVVGNSVTAEGLGFESDHNRYLVCPGQGTPQVIGPGPKSRLVKPLWDQFINL